MAHPRNPETSYCEVRKSQRDQKGISYTLEVIARVQGVARAQAIIETCERHMTEEEKKAGITYYWEYTSRRLGRGVQTKRRRSTPDGRPNRRKGR